MMLKNILKSDLESIIPAETATFKDLYKLAISYSDGIILHSDKIDPN